MKYFLIALLQLGTFSVAIADTGGEVGNGGDSRCADYTNIAGKIAVELLQIGQDRIDDVNKVINVDEIWKIKKGLRCIPVTALDRQARSYPDGHTELLVKEWEKLTIGQKVRLTAHELAVIAGYESDGEYFISESIVELVVKSSSYFNKAIFLETLKTKSKSVIENSDGSYTLIYPEDRINGGWYGFADAQSNLKGVCIFLGFKQYVTSHSDRRSQQGSFILIDEFGHFMNLQPRDNPNMLELTSITCTNNLSQ
jgi:hypothetical protein